ncbi:SecDF P1 head subdomain-containing protein [Bordetella genomosp. 12]|uniref:SecDF P1 head subdomain domain-containing protein n=1 Tax=Bordetella genomosp. 12 TaxID=463035 RepID=A0A261VL69_9BORD|nr:hypothetical protein [Bordetella genomosp. 12]OZI74835.1 hypothetical protein CAL22_10390 [Bordetella genomosp. 12]
MFKANLVPAMIALLILGGCQNVPSGKAATAASPASQAAAAPAAGSAPAASQRSPAVDFRLAQTKAGPNLTEVKLANGSVWVTPQPVLTRADLTAVAPVRDDKGNTYVRFDFTPQGAQRLAEVTRKNVGRLLFLTVNNDIAAIPQISDPALKGTLLVRTVDENQALQLAKAVAGPKAGIVPGTPQ